MQGLMQAWPLTVNRFLDHALRSHGHRAVVSRANDGSLSERTYAEIHARAMQVSNALLALGVQQGDRVATLAFNTARHVEVWYGIMGIGAVCHTLNPRLSLDQLIYIVNHAQDRLIFADPVCADLLRQVLAQCPSVTRVVWLDDSAPPFRFDVAASSYEEWIGAAPGSCVWGEFDEETAAGLCYTSGTTGEPKGVLYSHRSNFLHTLSSLQPDVMGLSTRDAVLPIVPMFHANAWGLIFCAPAVGAKLVLPGAQLDGASIHELLESYGVTFCAGVPTVLQALLRHVEENALQLTTLRRVLTGGSACPRSLIESFEARGVEVNHAWGMTELSPIGTVCSLTPEVAALPPEKRMSYRLRQGRAPCGVELRIAAEDGEAVKHDGVMAGHIKVRGPAVASAYFRREDDPLADADGFLDTGDVGTLDPQGYLGITDRAKDMIKSGGEWISSQLIEAVAAGHPKTALCAVIGIAHSQWGERPLLILQLRPQTTATAQEYLDFIGTQLPRWQVPDQVEFINTMPLGATGKVDKKVLRISRQF